jgi:hypothetical protein
MNKEQLINMSLHEIKELNKDLTIIKVLGGLIYIYKHPAGGITSEFVSLRNKG